MNILLTNDDGIYSEGLQKLAKALRIKHRVYIMAPDCNRSGVSHGFSILNDPVKLTALEEDTWSCTGTPVDCVIVALKGALSVKPDLVLAGINCGENLGTDIVYSGTAAAARQASLAGIPAVALSLVGSESYYWDMAVAWSAENLEKLAALWRKDSFVNVNIPNSPEGPRGLAMTLPGIKCYNDNIKFMTAPDNSCWCFLVAGPEKTLLEEGSDCEAVSRNFVSVSSVYNHPIVRD